MSDITILLSKSKWRVREFMVICLNEWSSYLSQISWLCSFLPQPAMNILWEREDWEIIVPWTTFIWLETSSSSPFLRPVCMVLESLAQNVLIWNPGHPSCQCRLLCRCKKWVRNAEGMDFHGCISLFKEDSETHFIEFLFMVIAPKYKSTSCYLFKLFKKPELSCRFKEWYSQCYIGCFRK